MFYEKYKPQLEAMLFVCAEPLPVAQIEEVLQIDRESVAALIKDLQADMAKNDRGLMIKQVGDAYQMCTKPQMAKYLEKMTEMTDKKLTVPALETLSIIAFKQPITKQEIEDIRGVHIDSIINKLLERELIQELGRKKVIGRPILYGTTSTFLQCFGISDLDELPSLPG